MDEHGALREHYKGFGGADARWKAAEAVRAP
jgi:hypothetical protein